MLASDPSSNSVRKGIVQRTGNLATEQALERPHLLEEQNLR